MEETWYKLSAYIQTMQEKHYYRKADITGYKHVYILYIQEQYIIKQCIIWFIKVHSSSEHLEIYMNSHGFIC